LPIGLIKGSKEIEKTGFLGRFAVGCRAWEKLLFLTGFFLQGENRGVRI